MSSAISVISECRKGIAVISLRARSLARYLSPDRDHEIWPFGPAATTRRCADNRVSRRVITRRGVPQRPPPCSRLIFAEPVDVFMTFPFVKDRNKKGLEMIVFHLSSCDKADISYLARQFYRIEFMGDAYTRHEVIDTIRTIILYFISL